MPETSCDRARCLIFDLAEAVLRSSPNISGTGERCGSQRQRADGIVGAAPVRGGVFSESFVNRYLPAASSWVRCGGSRRRQVIDDSTDCALSRGLNSPAVGSQRRASSRPVAQPPTRLTDLGLRGRRSLTKPDAARCLGRQYGLHERWAPVHSVLGDPIFLPATDSRHRGGRTVGLRRPTSLPSIVNTFWPAATARAWRRASRSESARSAARRAIAICATPSPSEVPMCDPTGQALERVPGSIAWLWRGIVSARRGGTVF